jgi:hypothetical protein
VAGNASDLPSPARIQAAIRYDLYKRLVPVLYIAASAIPIWAMVPIAQAFAGRQTNLTLTFTAAITVSVVLGGGNVLQWWRGRQQGKELRRLREQITKLEGKGK